MNVVLPTLHDRLNLEKRFVLSLLGLFALLVFGSVAYVMLATPHVSALAVLLLGVAAGAMAASVAHRWLFEPLRQLVGLAKAIRAGDLSQRLDTDRGDELGMLATEMNSICDRLQAAERASEAHIAALEQLRHSERVATLGRIASSVAHELGNPLNVIELRAQLVASGDVATLGEAQKNAAVILEQTRRMTRIIDEILSFTRMQPAQLTRFDLVAVVRKAIALCEHTSRKHKACIRLDVSPAAIEIDGDADKLLQVVVNLVINGVQSMPSGGTLSVRVRRELLAPREDPHGTQQPFVCIEVTDQGVGIEPSAVAKVFEPFYSTKSAQGGTGLGLSVAQGIVREHAGWIAVTSDLGRGTSFTVHLPMPYPHEPPRAP